jgi:hypothetical protein
VTDHHRELNDGGGAEDSLHVVVRPETAYGVASLAGVATITASAQVIPAPDVNTTGMLNEYRREIRYSFGDEDGVRYVEVVDEKGEHIVSGMGDAADALTKFILYLLPPDHPDYPAE